MRHRAKIDARTTCHVGCALSELYGKRIEEFFGGTNAQAGLAKTNLRGRPKVEAALAFAVAAYNLGRFSKLLVPAFRRQIARRSKQLPDAHPRRIDG